MRIRVGNLSSSATESDLWTIFERCGPVLSVHLVTSRDTGMRLGFAFVEMEEVADGLEAIQTLHGSDLCGRSLHVQRIRREQPVPSLRGH